MYLRIIIILLLAGVIFIFLPSYELVKVQKGFTQEESFTTIENGFFSRESCRETAKQHKLENYQCRKTRIWKDTFSGFLNYNYEPPRGDHSNEQNSGQD